MWQYNYRYSSNELYHHGILGMKWGVRRFQRKDGSLTPAGKKRYDDSDDSPKEKIKSSHRLKLEEKYRAKGMTKKQAEAAASKRIKTEKILAAAAAVTIAAATAYAVNKNIQERTDKIIKAGTKMQVVSREADKNFDRAFYAAYKKGDNQKYRGYLGKTFQNITGEAYKTTLGVNKDVKIASKKKAADVFADLYKNNSEFRQQVNKNNSDMGAQYIFNPQAKAGNLYNKINKQFDNGKKDMTDKILRNKGYDAFNIGLVNHTTDKKNEMIKTFYDKMKSLGYDGIEDINDQKYSGYNSKSPIILFDKAGKITVDSVKKMTEEEVIKDAKIADIKLMAPHLVKTGAAYTAAFSGVAALTNASKISLYRKQNPGTSMTDKEILEALKKARKR